MRFKFPLLPTAASALLGAACTTFPKPAAYGTQPASHSTTTGEELCLDFMHRTQTQATEQTIAGWTTIIGGGVTTVVGGFIGPGNSTGNSFSDKLEVNRNVLLSTGGLALVAMGWNFINRGAAAAEASSATSLAVAENRKAPEPNDRELYSRCLGIRSVWMDGVVASPELENIAPQPTEPARPKQQPAAPAPLPAAPAAEPAASRLPAPEARPVAAQTAAP